MKGKPPLLFSSDLKMHQGPQLVSETVKGSSAEICDMEAISGLWKSRSCCFSVSTAALAEVAGLSHRASMAFQSIR